MELVVYSLLLIVLFLGVIFNLKITNAKKVNEIKSKFPQKVPK